MIGAKNLAGQLVAAVLFQQQRPRSKTGAVLRAFSHWGGLGLLPLAILDSSLIPTFGSLDVLLAFLSARQSDLWFYYASMATLGSVIGSVLTYKLGQKLGFGWAERKFGRRRSMQVEYALERWGFGALFISTVAPPPFPTAIFLLSAGAFNYHLREFLGAVFCGRAIRYCLLGVVAAHYGRTMVRYMRHPGQHLWLSLGITLVVVLITVCFVLVTRDTPELSPEAQAQPQN